MKFIRFSLYYLLILLLILFSFGTVFYNLGKMIPEYRGWGRLSDLQKREKLFGEVYDEFVFIQSHTKSNAQILFYSSNGMDYYVLRYYLYPRKLSVASSKNDFLKLMKTKKFTYAFISHEHITAANYKEYVLPNNGNQSTFYTAL